MRRLEDVIGLLWVLTVSVLVASLARLIDTGRGLGPLAVVGVVSAVVTLVAAYALRGDGYVDPARLSVRDVAPFVASVAISGFVFAQRAADGLPTTGMSGDDQNCTLFFDHGARTEVLSGPACRAASIALGREFLGAALLALAFSWAYSRVTRRTAPRHTTPPPG